MKLRVDPAQQVDLQTLASLWCEKMLLVAPVRASDCMSKRAHLASILTSQPKAALFVARDSDTIVGYIAARLTETAVAIEDMTLETHQVHASAAHLLIDAVSDWAKCYKRQRLIVRMRQLTAVEQAFWSALGATKAETSEQGMVEYWLTR